MTDNPLLADWNTPFEVAPFAEIEPGHYREAFDIALERERDEIDAIASNPAQPDFANTIDALELAGHDIERAALVFFNLTGADTNETLQAIERDYAPKFAQRSTEIFFNRELFARIDTLMENRAALGLTPEQDRVLERTHTAFVRSGAKLEGEARERLEAINQRLAVLSTEFSQNVLADESNWELVLDSEDDLAGLPGFVVDGAAGAAVERGHEGKHAITLSRSLIEPFLTFSTRRDLREEAFGAWIARGENYGETDNRGIAAEMIALRAELARLMDYPTYADYKLDDEMARTPAAVRDLLMGVWEPARARALAEQEKLAEAARDEGANIEIAPWDWRFYAEKVRRAEYDVDETEVKPYLQLDRIIEAAFDTATRLFGITFAERGDIPVYHPDVRAFEVTARDGSHLAVFLGDYFARPSKRSGAWMSRFRAQHKLTGDVRPVIANVCNFAKPADGAPVLITFDDARTIFHEFGHALHGMLSDVTYPSVSGTSVLRDFVELPSQLYEHWLEEPEVLSRFALHHETGEPMPQDLLNRVLAASNFNQGFSTVEYTASALVDLDLHLLDEAGDLDVGAFESSVCERIGMPDAITLRHRPTHFAHIFAGAAYASGYYSYMWSEVMDADAVSAFKEAGDIFDPETARSLHDNIYSAGGRQDPVDAYTAFRGRMPEIDALLEKRGLKAA